MTDLTADDFEILEDGQPQTIRYFAAGDAADAETPALHLGVLLDVSEQHGRRHRASSAPPRSSS